MVPLEDLSAAEPFTGSRRGFGRQLMMWRVRTRAGRPGWLAAMTGYVDGLQHGHAPPITKQSICYLTLWNMESAWHVAPFKVLLELVHHERCSVKTSR